VDRKAVHVLIVLLFFSALSACDLNGGTERIVNCFGSPGQFSYSPPTVVDGAIYIGSGLGFHDYDPSVTNYFYKLDMDLNQLWAYSLGNDLVRGAAVVDSNNNIYFVVQTQNAISDYSNARLFLRSIDANGIFRWDREIGGPGAPNVGMLSPALSSNDTVYVVTKLAYAFNAAGADLFTGSAADWRSNAGSMNAPIIDSAGNIYFSASGKVYSLTSSGVTRWSFDSGGFSSLSSLAFNLARDAVIAPIGDTLYKVRVSDGSMVWSYTPPGIGGEFRATPAIDGADNIYLGTKNNENSVFYAVKADGSGLLWQNPIGADLYSSPVLGNDGILYVGSERVFALGGDFHAIDMVTGEVLWTQNVDAGTWASTPFFANGKLYSAQRAKICSFEATSTDMDTNAASGKFRGTNENTGRYP